MDAREIIAHQIPGSSAEQCFGIADGIIDAIRAAGFSIVHDSENHGQTLERAADRERELEDVLARIRQWCAAYPIDMFPEPDFKEARKLLAAGGITLDAISASNMRHVVNGIIKIIDAFPIRAMGEKQNG